MRIQRFRECLIRSALVGPDTWPAIESLLSEPLIGLDSIRQAREFLDISGLLRFPRFRTLTRQEKRRRIKRLIKENAAPAACEEGARVSPPVREAAARL
jgi:hypothetical protein